MLLNGQKYENITVGDTIAMCNFKTVNWSSMVGIMAK
jgi:hypothetical protein